MKRLASILLIVGLLVVVAPVAAQDEVSALPTINTPASGRADAVTLLNGVTFEVAQVAFVGNRQHLVIIDYLEGVTREIVTIGRDVYYRINTETRWKQTTIDQARFPTSIPTAEPFQWTEGARFFNMGETAINGTLTVQYHIEYDRAAIPERAAGKGVTYLGGDIFVGVNDGYIHKNQFKDMGTDPTAGDYAFEGYFVMSAFDTPVVVNPPPSDIVDPASGPVELPLLFFQLQQYR